MGRDRRPGRRQAPFKLPAVHAGPDADAPCPPLL